MSSYKSYHSHLKILAINNLLPDYYKKIIPNSTISTWKLNAGRINNTIGLNSFVSEEDFMKIIENMSKRALFYKTCRAMLKLFDTYSSIIGSIKGMKKVLKSNKHSILNCVAFLKQDIGIKRACMIFNISTNQYSHWKNSILVCTSSTIKLCRKKYNHQLLGGEVTVIEKYFTVQQYKYWPISSVYYQIMRDKAAYFSIATCYNYVKLLGINRFKKMSRRKHHTIGLRAKLPFELLHMDITIFRTLDNAKVYIYLICDNYSRSILGYKASTDFNVKLVLENIKEVKQKYNLRKGTQLIVDNGIENKTIELNKFVKVEKINKQIAQLNIIESNSMIENIIKQLKYYHIYPKDYKTPSHFINDLDNLISSIQNRPRANLGGFTPLEVENGQIPLKNTFKLNVKASKTERLIKNRNQNCSMC